MSPCEGDGLPEGVTPFEDGAGLGVSPYEGDGLPEGVTPLEDEASLGVSPYEGDGLPEGVTPYVEEGPPMGATPFGGGTEGETEEPTPSGWPAGDGSRAEETGVVAEETGVVAEGTGVVAEVQGAIAADHGTAVRTPPASLADVLGGYATQFKHLDVSRRIEIARTAEDPDLLTLCIDPDPQVIDALLGNPRCGLFHARRIALHHRNPVGLELLSRRGELMRDGQVQRNLLRNPQLTESILQRIASRKQLLEIYQLCLDREVPEQGRLRLRRELGKRFNNGSPDEKVELVFRTEGRALLLLPGCTFDPKSVSLLTHRTIGSLVLVQNLARFPATPPAVLAKLIQLPMVTRQPAIRQLLLRHPNLPGEAKRRS
ncbi:MAG: hypothetical protein JW751_21665 [Polyangiaceae bacterium]|nr:hypothetical protein [Polyangiaceae bacterium]